MNKQLENFARRTLKEGLAQCSGAQQLRFKRMYAHDNLDWPIDDVVDGVEAENLDWAMQQVQRTLDVNGAG